MSAASDGPGTGSEFVVRQPRRAPQEQPAARPPAPAAAGTLLRVLIVDDNHDAAEMLDCAVRNMGHLTFTASDGPSALTAAERIARTSRSSTSVCR